MTVSDKKCRPIDSIYGNSVGKNEVKATLSRVEDAVIDSGRCGIEARPTTWADSREEALSVL